MINLDVDNTNLSSLSGKIFLTIKEKILDGDFKAGESLTEGKLSSEFGVSRTPIREALKQLELDGLVDLIPNRGAIVTGVSEKDMRDMYEMRKQLEILAVTWAIENSTDEQLEELKKILDLEEFYTVRDDKKNLMQLDSKFHKCIYDASGSKTLTHTVSTLYSFLKRARNYSFEKPGRAEAIYLEHKAIYDAIESKDKCEAKKVMKLHIDNASKSNTQTGE